MRTDRDGAPLASVDAEDAAQRADQDAALLAAAWAVLPGTGSPAEVRAYAANLRAQAAEERADADHLDEIAGALERWADREERVAEALPFVKGPDAEMTAREYFERQGGGSA